MSEPESNQKEFIICAAVMYKGNMITGYRHGDCINVIKLLVEDLNEEDIPDRKDQGFLTSKNRYVSRNEAFKIAQENKQIWHSLHEGVEENQLVSEDLY